MVRRAIRLPKTRPVFPRISSATSGFFFWGIMLEPVVKVSDISINPNSSDDHKTSSSARRERCIIQTDEHDRNSIAKSLSETESILFLDTELNPNSFATDALSIGSVVPANAQEPSGRTSMRFMQSSKRLLSL